MRILHRFADPALRDENFRLELRHDTDQQTIRLQADKIKQLEATFMMNPMMSNRLNNIRPCLCGLARWERWRDGAIAGADGVVGTMDDDLVPENKI